MRNLKKHSLTSSVTRLHPIEFSTGTAAGVAASYFIRNELSVHSAWAQGTAPTSPLGAIRARLSEPRVQGQTESRFTPVEWQAP